MLNEKNILQALKSIIDPDFNQDIVSLGFVKDIKIKKKFVSFTIELTTAACPVKEIFKEQAEKNVKALEGVEEVKVMMSVATNQNKLLEENSGLNQVTSIVAISSCKGGVGKSTLAASFAKELVSRGYKVGLLDADIYGPSLPTLFSLYEVTLSFNEKQQIIPEFHEGLKLMSFGFLSKEAPAVMRGPMVSNYIQQFLHKVDWGELDYLFIDMPPGTGDIQLTITQSISLAGAIIVTTPHGLSMVDVGKGILMFEKVNVPVLGIIENMSYFFCKECHRKYYLFGQEATLKLHKRFGIEILGKIPISTDFANQLALENKDNSFKEITDQIIRSLGKSLLKKFTAPKIIFDNQSIMLEWEDEKSISISNENLRYYCNSARNVDEKTGVRFIKRKQIRKDIRAVAAGPLGNYAIYVNWNDQHRSIFPYNYLKELFKKIS